VGLTGATEGDPVGGGGGEMLIPCPVPVLVHPTSAARTAPTAHVRRIEPEPTSGVRGVLRCSDVEPRRRARPAGAPAAFAAAGVAFATAAVYVALIVSQGEAQIAGIALVTAWIVGLGGLALVGALRPSSDRVIALGAAAGGLIGAAVVSLFSIGALLLVGGILALASWVRAGVEASRREQLLGGLAGVAAALGFLVVVLSV
jgi:hypothetical protein